MRYKLSHWIEYAFLRGVAAWVNLLPYRAALVFGCGIAGISFLFMRARMGKVRRRLEQVFGGSLTAREMDGILWRSWRNLVFNTVETLRIPSMTLEWIKKTVDTSEFHKAKDAMKNGKGVILAVPHMGNWELAGIAVQMMGLSLMVIVRTQKNPLTNAFLNRMREHTGVEAVMKEAKMFGNVFRKLREGCCLAILPDVRSKMDAVKVQFLGVEANIPRGMAFFAREAGVPIIPAVVCRHGWTHHSWRGFEPVWPDMSLERDQDIQRMTQIVMSHFDRMIRENPDQYFWFNGRWVLGEDKKC